jgi:photosystem II stability/assembly factor-like uncharacterized protein
MIDLSKYRLKFEGMKPVIYFLLILPFGFISCSPEKVDVIPMVVDTLGAGWTKHKTNLGTMTDVAFTDPARGFLATHSGIHRSVDSGKTWTPAVMNQTTMVYTINFMNAQNGYFMGERFGFTTDGGATWRTVAGSPRGIDVWFTTTSNGFNASDSGLLKTADGGNTWSMAETGRFSCVYFTDAQNGWAGKYGALLKTSNGGTTWTQAYALSNSSEYISAIQFRGQRGWMSTSASRIFRTTDGGNTWVPYQHWIGTAYDVHFVDDQVGFAIFGRGIYRSNNGGATWTKEASVATEELYEIFFLDANTGWASGDDGIVLRLKR